MLWLVSLGMTSLKAERQRDPYPAQKCYCLKAGMGGEGESKNTVILIWVCCDLARSPSFEDSDDRLLVN